MKNTKKCPKCGSDVILEIDYGSKILRNQWVHTGSTLLSSVVVTAVWYNPIWYRNQYIPVGLTIFSAVPVTSYVCAAAVTARNGLTKTTSPSCEKSSHVYIEERRAAAGRTLKIAARSGSHVAVFYRNKLFTRNAAFFLWPGSVFLQNA